METDWKEKYQLAVKENLLNNKKESRTLCNELLCNQHVRKNLDNINLIEKLNNLNIEYNETELINYPADKIQNILSVLNNKKNMETHQLTLTITTCKRIDLFEKTINSFINCCEDNVLIDRWICVDDNSSKEDRNIMKQKYPFFEFYFKTEKEKGHSISMNMIQELVKSPFILHLEDDWLFIEKSNLIQDSLHILNSTQIHYIDSIKDTNVENKKIAQVLFNKNYAEDESQVIHGGYLAYTGESPNFNFLIHQHCTNNETPLKQYLNCCYWPHFSFRPSIFRREIFNKLGKFDDDGFFELSYAKKYYSSNYISCFHNKIQSIHIGKKTWEKDKKNAYNLNGVNQFLSTTNIEKKTVFFNDTIFCINLEYRTDRKANMENEFNKYDLKYKFFNAICGRNLKPTKELLDLFSDNDFDSTVGAIGCALSHKKVWEDLVNDSTSENYIIFEDDTILHPQIKTYFVQIQEKLSNNIDWDFLFLSYIDKKVPRDLINIIPTDFENVVISLQPLDRQNYMGGFHAYIISKSGAKKMLQYINKNGIKHGIDYLIQICPNLICLQLKNYIVYAKWAWHVKSNVDTDIQLESNILDIYSDDNFQYIRKLDFLGNDVHFMRGKKIADLKKYALENDCDGFNTLGFVKSNICVEKLCHSQYFKKLSDGLFIKRNLFDKNNQRKVYTRIKLLCNWCSSKDLCNDWNHMSKGNYKWDNIEITWKDDNIDFFIIINKPNSNEYYNPKRTIIFQMEPWCGDVTQTWGIKTWKEWSLPDPDVFLQVRRHKYFLNNCMWQLSTSYTQFMKEPIKKNEDFCNTISSICSSKYFDPGHKKRIDFLKYIETKCDPYVQLHIYNENNFHKFNSYIGKVMPHIDKDKGIIPYKYYFMCENNSEYNFVTEKLWEPLLAESLVFYWGCPNVSDYINPLAYVELDMNDFEKSFNTIKNAIKDNLWEQRLPIIREEKQKVLNYYNFFPTVERILFEDFKFSQHPTDEEITLKKVNVKMFE